MPMSDEDKKAFDELFQRVVTLETNSVNLAERMAALDAAFPLADDGRNLTIAAEDALAQAFGPGVVAVLNGGGAAFLARLMEFERTYTESLPDRITSIWRKIWGHEEPIDGRYDPSTGLTGTGAVTAVEAEVMDRRNV